MRRSSRASHFIYYNVYNLNIQGADDLLTWQLTGAPGTLKKKFDLNYSVS